MGRDGIYFRQTLPSARRAPIRSGQMIDQTTVDFRETETGEITEMVDSSSAALLDEIRAKARKPRLWPWILSVGFFLEVVIGVNHEPIWSYFLAGSFFTVLLIVAVHFDRFRKTVVLSYALEPLVEEAYQRLHASFESLQSCSRVWHVAAQGSITTTYDWKVNAGARSIVRRKATSPRFAAPPYFQCNISIPVLPGGRQCLYFLPDRVLVWSGSDVGAISVDRLQISVCQARFIETSELPSDAQVVGKTWRYVNKGGGPDRRFSNNREIPIALYEEVQITGEADFRELFQVSRTGVATLFKSAVAGLASSVSQPDPAQNAVRYLKCPCNNCDTMIEYPAYGLGDTIKCPHCKSNTVLFALPCPSPGES